MLFLLSGCLSGCVRADVAPWRSSLYPVDWTPQTTGVNGRFLHDFSYAGYRNGEEPAEGGGGTVFDAVMDFHADPTGATDSTAALQAAIDAATAAGGGVVYVPEGLYHCDGVLDVAGSNIIVRGAGRGVSKIYFTAWQDMAYSAHFTFHGALAQAAEFPLAEDGADRANTVPVADATGLTVGDEVSLGWIITDDFIAEHGMTGIWTAFNGQWQPIFRRTVTDIDTSVSPALVELDVPLRYAAKLRDGASLRKETGYASGCGIEDLSLANAVTYADAWTVNQVALLQFRDMKDSWIRRVDTFESPLSSPAGYHLQSYGIYLLTSKRLTVADCTWQKAQNRGDHGNGYIYQVSQCNEVLVRDCTALDGRHNFIQNWGFGTAGCVFLRDVSRGSTNMVTQSFGLPAKCEYHHSLAMGCLVDSCTLDDGWIGGNRGTESTGAGHTVTESVYWNNQGAGQLSSWQYGKGYIVGTSGLSLDTAMTSSYATGTTPQDFVEGKDKGGLGLHPVSLYEDQRARRLGLGIDLGPIAEGEGEGENAISQSGDLDRNNTFSLSELLRLIQLYNLGGLHCEAGTEDGFAPGATGDTACAPHTTDYNPQDWSISLSELLRAIQFYNAGGFFWCPNAGTEDGFCPGNSG